MSDTETLHRILEIVQGLAARLPVEPGFRLESCGDWLTVDDYSKWMRQSKNTTYQQLHTGSAFVAPATLKPRPLWRRLDCEAKFRQRDLVVHQRKERAKKRRTAADNRQKRPTA